MFSVLVASFVVACALFTIWVSIEVIRAERRQQAWLDQQIEEDILAGVFDPEWMGPALVRMDVPRKYPAVRTRSTRVLSGK